MPSLRQLVYVSSTPHEIEADSLTQILTSSRRRNAAAAVTGALLYLDCSFFQVLEGAPDDVEGVYSRVQQDPRHRGILTLLDRRVPERQFPDWAMGLLDADRLSLQDREAVQRLAEVDAAQPGPVRHLLNSFRSTMSGARTAASL